MADPGLGNELKTLTDSFNTMAEGLETVETTRRRLLADLGHELRTPLATIEAYLEAAEDGIAVDDKDLQSVLQPRPRGCTASPTTSPQSPAPRHTSSTYTRYSEPQRTWSGTP